MSSSEVKGKLQEKHVHAVEECKRIATACTNSVHGVHFKYDMGGNKCGIQLLQEIISKR